MKTFEIAEQKLLKETLTNWPPLYQYFSIICTLFKTVQKKTLKSTIPARSPDVSKKNIVIQLQKLF